MDVNINKTTTMTYKEFKFLTKEMREAQKAYFKDKQYTTLVVAKALERQVDKELSPQIDIFYNTKRYFKCSRCGSKVMFFDGRQNMVCTSPFLQRTSGICGGNFDTEITEEEYNEN